MQTFIPEGSDFAKTAALLDFKRLNKQGVEIYQIMRINAGLTIGFKNHPACLMWKGHESTLYKYAEAIYTEIGLRGFKTNTMFKIQDVYRAYFTTTKTPEWLDDIRVIITHRGNLFRKFPEHYPQYANYKDYLNYVCCERCNYFWPTHT